MPAPDLNRLDEVARHSRRAGRRYDAVKALGGEGGPEADRLLLALVRDPVVKGPVRAEALRALADRHHEDAPVLVEAACADPDRQVRLFAVARVVHEVDPERARTALSTAQQDDSRLVRAIADRALQQLPASGPT